jgi:predicted RNase H-like HicB family nuclease
MTSKKLTLNIETKRGTYEAVFGWDVKDKAYIVSVPSLSGVVTFGKNLKDAKRMIKDAIELYCDCLIDEGNIIIDDTKKAFGKIPHSRIIAVR